MRTWTRTFWIWPSEPVAVSSSLRRPFITTCRSSTGGGAPACPRRCVPCWARWRASYTRTRPDSRRVQPIRGMFLGLPAPSFGCSVVPTAPRACGETVGSVVENSRLPGDYQETLGMTLGIAKRPLTWGFVCRKLPPSATATRADDREKRRVPSRKPARKPGLMHRSAVTNQKVADRFNGGGAPTEVVLGHAGVRPWVGRLFQRRVRPAVELAKAARRKGWPQAMDRLAPVCRSGPSLFHGQE